MKTFLTAVASIALLAAPLASISSPAMARGGGFGGGGGFHGGGGFRGGIHGGGVSDGFQGRGFQGGGYQGGGFRGRGFGGGYGAYDLGAADLGFALGLDYADPWFYDDAGYYDDDYDLDGAPPPMADQPSPSQIQPPQACGSWQWDGPRSTYDWVPCAQ